MDRYPLGAEGILPLDTPVEEVTARATPYASRTPILEHRPTSISMSSEESPAQPTGYLCGREGCKRASKPFKRPGDLRRHQLNCGTHTEEERFSCCAVDCNRTGQRGFSRKDKWIDHMIDGHDDDTPFNCPADRCSQGNLPRQLISVHCRKKWVYHSGLYTLNTYRKCPIPRCKFRIHMSEEHSPLDALQDHLRSDHPRKTLLTFQARLVERGYDALSGDIFCPICPDFAKFSKHMEFYRHFAGIHLHMPDTLISGIRCHSHFHGSVYDFLSKSRHVPYEVREHRRTILSLWPMFIVFDAVWDDIRYKWN